MIVKVLAFGQLSECISEKELFISSVNDSEELRAILLSKFPGIKEINFLIAVNKKVISENTSLNDQDEVALLPAFSGG